MDCYASQCSDCGRQTAIIEDLQSGDTICSECGLVIDSHWIDMTPEYRTFASDDNDSKDRSRVGARIDPLFGGAGLSTVIADSKNSKFANELNRSNRHVEKNGHQNLIERCKIIEAMADRLEVSLPIKKRADQIFQELEEKKSCKGRNSAALPAAALFVACAEAGVSRTLTEITAVAEGIRPKDINKAVKLIREEIQVETVNSAARIAETVKRFCSRLKMGTDAVKAVQEAVQKAEEIDVRRNPKTIFAGIVYMVCQIKGVKIPDHELAAIVEVAESTIKKSVRDLLPYASKLIPEWFAGEEKIKKIICP